MVGGRGRHRRRGGCVESGGARVDGGPGASPGAGGDHPDPVTDLAILVPSRGRPANVARLIEACEKTCRTGWVLSFGFDEDDPHLDANLATYEDRVDCTALVLPRKNLTEWTNELASFWRDTPYLASLGDDMVPLTDGW